MLPYLLATLTLALPFAIILKLILAIAVLFGLTLYLHPDPPDMQRPRGRHRPWRPGQGEGWRGDRDWDFDGGRGVHAYAYGDAYQRGAYGMQRHEYESDAADADDVGARAVRTRGLGGRGYGLGGWGSEQDRAAWEWALRERGPRRFGAEGEGFGFGGDAVNERHLDGREGDGARASRLRTGIQTDARAQDPRAGIHGYDTPATTSGWIGTTLIDSESTRESSRAGEALYLLRPETHFGHYHYADEDEDGTRPTISTQTQPQPQPQHEPHPQLQLRNPTRAHPPHQQAQSRLYNNPSSSLSGETLVTAPSQTTQLHYEARPGTHFGHYDYADTSDPDPALPHPHWAPVRMGEDGGASGSGSTTPGEGGMGTSEGAVAMCPLCQDAAACRGPARGTVRGAVRDV